MTNYNERLEEILANLGERHIMVEHRLVHLGMPEQNGKDIETREAKQAITSLIKELVAEARINELKHLVNDDGIWHQDMTRKFPQKIRLEERIKELEKFEQNLLKALEEV